MISPRYKRALDRYWDWIRCTTPMTGQGFPGDLGPFPDFRPDAPHQEGHSAAECLMAFESTNTVLNCREPRLYALLARGKSNRDYWTKEISWWNRNAVFNREEFVAFLTPEAYLELFGLEPATMRVRYWFDNNYTDGEFERDMGLASIGLERGPEGLRIAFAIPGEAL